MSKTSKTCLIGPKTAKKVIFKGDGSFDQLVSSLTERLITCQGTLQNYSKTLRTAKKLSGMLKTSHTKIVKKSQKRQKRVIFKGDGVASYTPVQTLAQSFLENLQIYVGLTRFNPSNSFFPMIFSNQGHSTQLFQYFSFAR